MLNLQNYLNSSGELKLYKYKIINLKNNEFLKLHSTQNDLIILEQVDEINGYLNNSVLNLNEKTDNEQILFNYFDTFTLSTNQNVFEPLQTMNKDFYLFALKNEYDIDFNKDEIYYIDSNSQVDYDFSDTNDDENYLYQITFSNVKQLKNYDLDTIEYKLKKYVNNEFTKYIELEVEPSMLFSDLVFVGRRIKDNGEIENNVIPEIKIANDVLMYPHLMHPMLAQKDYIYWYDNFNSFVEIINEFFTNSNILTFEPIFDFLKKEYEFTLVSSDFIEILNKILNVTITLTSNYSNFKENKEKEIKKFKEEIYSGSNPKEFCDFQIKTYFDKLTLFNQKVRKTFELIFLMFSQYISSSFCFKGGLTQEHELFLPFYVEIKGDEKNRGYILRSNYFYFDNKIKKWIPKGDGLLNHNTFEFHSNAMTLPVLPNQIEETNITNSPIDFNSTQSQNFNYLMWHPSNEKTIDNYLSHIKQTSKKDEYFYRTVSWQIAGGYTITHRTSIEPFAEEKFEARFDSEEDFRAKARFIPVVDEILRNPNYSINENEWYKRDNVKIYRKNFEKNYKSGGYSFGSQARNNSGWWYKYDSVWVYLTFKIKNIVQNSEFYKPIFLYKSKDDFLKNFDLNEPIKIKFVVNENNFILENISIKSIFASKINISVNNSTKTYKLSSLKSKLSSETKIII